MELKTSTVKSVQANGTYKEMNKWEVEMENGDCGENLTQDDQKYFIKGQTVEYEWHPGKYPKIKRPYKKDGQSGGFSKGKKQTSAVFSNKSLS